MRCLQLAFLADGAGHTRRLPGTALAERGHVVEGVGNFALHAGQVSWHPGREVARPKREHRGQEGTRELVCIQAASRPLPCPGIPSRAPGVVVSSMGTLSCADLDVPAGIGTADSRGRPT